MVRASGKRPKLIIAYSQLKQNFLYIFYTFFGLINKFLRENISAFPLFPRRCKSRHC